MNFIKLEDKKLVTTEDKLILVPNTSGQEVETQIIKLNNQVEVLQTTKADKTEVPTKLSQLEQDIPLGGSGGNVDLSDYYTKQEIDNKGYLTEHQSLDGYATEQYVQAAVSGLGGNVSGTIQAIETTYDTLKLLRDSGKLIAGQTYIITDYQCVISRAIDEGDIDNYLLNLMSANHQFDIIVVADSENTLNEVARARLHEGDTYFANSNLNAWELKYCLDAKWWIDEESGKGIIYYMKDEFENECWYDFKNIKFKGSAFNININNPYGIDFNSYYYTFDDKNGNDSSISRLKHVNHNIVKPYHINLYQYGIEHQPNFIIMLGTNCHHNVFNDNCHGNIICEYCYNNTFGKECMAIMLNSSCFNNTFANDCSFNVLDTYCTNNVFGNNCTNNVLGAYCSNNTFGFYCSENVFGNYCSYNIFESECKRNELGEKCIRNQLEIQSTDNKIGLTTNIARATALGSSNNRLGIRNKRNTIGDNSNNNQFATDCNDNEFGSDCNDNTLGNECTGNEFTSGCTGNHCSDKCKENKFIASISNMVLTLAFGLDLSTLYNIIENLDELIAKNAPIEIKQQYEQISEGVIEIATIAASVIKEAVVVWTAAKFVWDTGKKIWNLLT